MITERHYPSLIKHAELDAYLARGWYRMGQMIFTCHFLCFERGIYSPIWIRQDLENFEFKKRRRKLLRQNNKIFKVVYRKAVIDEEKEILYQVYKSAFKGMIAENLKDSLLDPNYDTIYDTYEVCIYLKDRLVAFSFFDNGGNSLASIIGVYDPLYKQYSLGLYTMLCEVEWGLKEGKKYFYPGYVVPGNSRFDYKVLVGDVDYYSPSTGKWAPYSSFDKNELPINMLREKLLVLSEGLTKLGIPNRISFYVHFEETIKELKAENFLQYPLYISVFHDDSNTAPLILEYDLKKKCYRFSRCEALNVMPSSYYSMLFQDYDINETTFMGFLIRNLILLETESAEQMISEIEQLL